MPEPTAASLLRPTRTDDLAHVAALHRDELSYGLFPRLGTGFLRRYHAALLDSPETVALVATDERGLAGFLVGSFDQPRHQHWMLRRRGLRLATAGMIGLLTHPRTLVLFTRTRARRYLRRFRRALPASTPAPAQQAAHLRFGVLLHVAVAIDRRGQGLGRLLTERFVTEAIARNVDELQLVTADVDAAAFYRRLGWKDRQTRNDSDGTAVTNFGLQLAERGTSAEHAEDAGDADPRGH